jgi:hypothetical protein
MANWQMIPAGPGKFKTSEDESSSSERQKVMKASIWQNYF